MGHYGNHKVLEKNPRKHRNFEDFLYLYKKVFHMYIVTKLLVFLLVFAILIVIREVLNFLLVMLSEDKSIKFNLTKKRLIILGVAISYIFTIIFTGFKFL